MAAKRAGAEAAAASAPTSQQPSYQQGLVIHNGGSTINPNGMRANPDVAFDANPNTGVAIYDSYNGGSKPVVSIRRHQCCHPLLGRFDCDCRPDAGLGGPDDFGRTDANPARPVFLADWRFSRHYVGHEYGQPELHGGRRLRPCHRPGHSRGKSARARPVWCWGVHHAWSLEPAGRHDQRRL